MATRTIPGPRGLPLLGHIPWFIADPLGFLQGLSRDYGDLAAFNIGMRKAVLVNEPSLIERIIKDRTFERSDATRYALASFLGMGLLSLEGPPHMRHRRLMQPAFHRERIKRYGEIMAEETYRTIDRWQGRDTLDLRAEMMQLTFAIVSRALFNSETRADAEAVDRALQRIQPAVIRAARLSGLLPTQLAVRASRPPRQAVAELDRLALGLVQRRRLENDDRGDLLSMLLAARDEDGSALSDEDVCAEMLTILFAGHETTAHTMTWAWYKLMQQPALQDALAQEVRAVVGDRPIGFDDLPKLTLADRIVRETLRMYPPAWWADRVSNESTELGGYTLPGGTVAVISVYVTHRDPRWFPDPLRFDPDRFLPERASKLPEGAYLPFGAGVHMCIGNTFALMEARLILAAMAQRFTMRAVDPSRVRPVPLVTLGMAEPFPVVPTRRASAPPTQLAETA